jgi:hypothetical protein
MSAPTETHLSISVKLSDVLGIVLDPDSPPITKEDVAGFFADAITEKSQLLGGLKNYLREFMDEFTSVPA